MDSAQQQNLVDLRPGDSHSGADVGPPLQYDFMGATQARLLWTLGLRAHHRLLDFGCGSLRTGRLLIPYLEKGNYHGVEPNQWLVEEAIEKEIGQDLIRIKSPRFYHNDDFAMPPEDAFDFIIAQSIFSHTGADLIQLALTNMRAALKPSGLLVVTFVEGDNDFEGMGWVYPQVVRYTQESIFRFGAESDLFMRRIPWYHPRQTWYLLSKDMDRLPSPSMDRYLIGAVLYEDEFVASLK